MANSTNIIVRESITEALLKLMKRKSFSDISITELTKTAGVGRVSFYRNFDSKEDVLEQYMEQLAGSHWNENHEENPAALWRLTFEIFEILKPVVLLIHKSEIDHVLYHFIRKCTQPNPPQSIEEGYHNAIFAGLAFGLYDQWISGGMKESPEELTALFHEVTLPYTPKPIHR